MKSPTMLMASWLCLMGTLRAQEPGTAAAPHSSSLDVTARPADLSAELGNILAVAKAGNREPLVGLLKDMRITKPGDWFQESFGQEKGAILSSAYTARVEADDQGTADQLIILAAKRGGDLYTVRLPAGPVAGEPFSTFALRASLIKPVVFYAASYLWKEEQSGLHKFGLGFLTQSGGKYRRLPGDLVWLLKGTGIGTPAPVAEQTPGSGNQSDAQLVRLLNAIAAVPPPPPPKQVIVRIPPGSNEVQKGGCELTNLKNGNYLATGPCQGAKLIKRVEPIYPPLARQTRISGTVQLHAIIGTDGTVQSLEVISGHPLLLQAAMNAVKQWRYQQSLLNGTPIEIDTTIDVIFSLNP
jgi:TonB family protein